jgi:hypothetical protein
LREGSPEVELVGSDGNGWLTAGTSIWILHGILQRESQYWVKPNEFLPERWLEGPEDPLYPVKGAYRYHASCIMHHASCIMARIELTSLQTLQIWSS